MVYDPFNFLLNSLCYYFADDFCTYIYRGYLLEVLFFCCLWHTWHCKWGSVPSSSVFWRNLKIVINSSLNGKIFQWNCLKVKMRAAQSSLTVCTPGDYTVLGILQASLLEWLAFSFSRGSSQFRDWPTDFPHYRQILYQLSHKGSHVLFFIGNFYYYWFTLLPSYRSIQIFYFFRT